MADYIIPAETITAPTDDSANIELHFAVDLVSETDAEGVVTTRKRKTLTAVHRHPKRTFAHSIELKDIADDTMKTRARNFLRDYIEYVKPMMGF